MNIWVVYRYWWSWNIVSYVVETRYNRRSHETCWIILLLCSQYSLSQALMKLSEFYIFTASKNKFPFPQITHGPDPYARFPTSSSGRNMVTGEVNLHFWNWNQLCRCLWLNSRKLKVSLNFKMYFENFKCFAHSFIVVLLSLNVLIWTLT